MFAILKEEESEEYRKDPVQKLGVLLIKRGGFPYKDYWALPGGFAQKGEELRDTALRELREETSVDSAFLEPFGFFSAPDRDPRASALRPCTWLPKTHSSAVQCRFLLLQLRRRHH